MSLIECPECGGKVSDKADACIHCGYPLKDFENSENEEENIYCIIKGVTYDLSPVLEAIINKENHTRRILDDIVVNLNDSQRTKLWHMIYKTHKIPKIFSKEVYDQYVDAEYQKNKREKLMQKGIDPDAPAVCPSCGSTQFSTLQRGHSLIFGWLGSGEPQNVCQKCGYKWTPGRR